LTYARSRRIVEGSEREKKMSTKFQYHDAESGFVITMKAVRLDGGRGLALATRDELWSISPMGEINEILPVEKACPFGGAPTMELPTFEPIDLPSETAEGVRLALARKLGVEVAIVSD
jgi:hypothetical protein